jgi:2-amino-4-hydroxy-6-hydroxymethyldihydropteridine diphosphokinase
MIIIALGSNMPGPWGSPQQAVERALALLDSGPSRLLAASHLIITEPFGRKNQPPFVNAAAAIDTHLSPDALMRRLHMIERQAGRQRRLRWGPRTLDLDLIDYHGLVRRKRTQSIRPLVLPHPGLHERLFVLEPLHEVAPRWRHPLTKESAAFTIRKLNRLNGA